MGKVKPVGSLKEQKKVVNEGISDAKENIAALEDKISRLRQAKKSITSRLSNLEGIQSDIDDFEVANSKWQGEGERNFEGKYNSYAIYVNAYESDTSKAKEQIEEDLEAAKAEKVSVGIGLENLENNLDRVESDMEEAKGD